MGLKNHYGLYEVIYNDEGKISAHTEEPEVIADTPEELIESLEMMLSDAKKYKNKILDYKTMKFYPLTHDDKEESVTLKELFSDEIEYQDPQEKAYQEKLNKIKDNE
tara:strand:+ start:750 stop:1070 length:321 start_codon:yes stop_codon:yes gene_type:complete